MPPLPAAGSRVEAAGWHWRLVRQCDSGGQPTGGRAASATRPHVIADIADILDRNAISLATIVQHEAPEVEIPDCNGVPVVPLVVMTHRTTEGQLRSAERELHALDSICKPYVRMPVAD